MNSNLFILLILLWPFALLAETNEIIDQPIEAIESSLYQMEILVNSGAYMDAQGRMVTDIYESSESFLAISVTNGNDTPVLGVKPTFLIGGTSKLMEPSPRAPLKGTDESGIMEFGIVAGVKGLDQLTVSYGNNSAELHFNIISLDFQNFPSLPELESGLSWNDLMGASLDYQEDNVSVTFTSNVMELSGKTVDIAGFMLPLDADTKQRNFLLVSSPPSCFYHFPGGAAGVVEVFSEDGIEATWSPLTLSGELVLVENSETGIIYQLKDAEVID
jgi:hypothetical protein